MGELFAGRYELVDLIGQGGMGTVWRVWDARAGTIVAAKVLRQSDAATLLRFVREQSVRIHHPHVVVPIGWAGEDDRVLFTMPVVRGGSVATLVQDFGPLPPLLVAELLRQLLDGLAAVHAAGIVHRDVKPANILLDATGTGRPHAYLSDFGISVDLNAPRWTETGVVSGTPGYLAPEMERLGTVSPSADLYAAGQVAMTMLLGARPSERAESAGRPPGVPAPLWDVVKALAAPDPEDRPADAGAARALLAAPELAWVPEAIGEVEVFEHVRGDAAGPPSVEEPEGGTTRPRGRAAEPGPAGPSGPAAGRPAVSDTPQHPGAHPGADTGRDPTGPPDQRVTRARRRRPVAARGGRRRAHLVAVGRGRAVGREHPLDLGDHATEHFDHADDRREPDLDARTHPRVDVAGHGAGRDRRQPGRPALRLLRGRPRRADDRRGRRRLHAARGRQLRLAGPLAVAGQVRCSAAGPPRRRPSA